MPDPGRSDGENPGWILRFEARAAKISLLCLMLLAALCGALAALAHAPFNLWPLGPLGIAGLFAAFQIAGTIRRAFWLGWAGGTGYFALALFWIVEPFFVDAARHGWMAPFALIFLSGGLALFWGAAFALARWLGGRRALLWIAAMVGAELARSYVLTGFPWALIGYVWAASPVAQLSALVGPHGLSILALVSGVALWGLGSHRLTSVSALVVLAFGLGAGLFLRVPAPPGADAPVIRMVQPNAPQHEKWHPDHVLTFFDRQIAFTAAPPQTARAPDLIVWPETAIPWMLADADAALQQISTAAGDTPVVLGLRSVDQGRLYNTLIALDADGKTTARYDKHHLVPFGEYVPLGNWAAKLGIHGLAANEGYGFSAGPGARLVDLPGIGPALPLICYEAVFPHDVNAAPSRPRLLLQITNDAWFGRFSGPFQHLQQARLRAIEQGLPMLRVANTGVSAMIGPRGEVLSRLPLGQAGVADVLLPDALPPTLYSRIGDWPVLVLLLISLLPGAIRRVLRQ